jgi:pimeloyl-ACP methyl ester carboxylesterase
MNSKSNQAPELKRADTARARVRRSAWHRPAPRGYLAQQITVDRPELVRGLILVGTSPRGESMAQLAPDTEPLYSTHIFSRRIKEDHA